MDAVTSDSLDDLVAHARQTHVIVVGGGIAGLVAAWECAKVGMSVTLLEASDRLGGVIRSARIAGLDIELGATCWSTRGGVMRRLLEEVAVDARIARSRTDDEWIAGIPKVGAARLPRATVLGIPANPWDEQVRRIIGWRGAWRAYVDRLRPPLTIGSERSLGRLVRARMGAVVHDRLVAPLSIDRFGLRPDDVDVDVAASALNPALTRTGSLAGAVAELTFDADSRPAYEGLVGGMPQLVAALHDRLVGLGVRVLTGTRALGMREVDGRWVVDTAPLDAVGAADVTGGDTAAESHPAGVTPRTGTPADTDASTASRAELTADAVIVATDEAAARSLLAGALDAPSLPAAPVGGIPRDVVTLVLDAPSLDAAPRGAHVHAIPGSHRAAGLVHETARWEWLADAVGPGTHVVRVAFGAPGAPPATEGLSDADATSLAVAEASALLGVPLDGRVIGGHREQYTLVPPASASGRLEAADALRAELTRARGLAAVGAWLAGSGLAQVVADAQREADRLRHDVLWTHDAPG